METLAQFILVMFLGTGCVAGLFMITAQPMWGMIDVAVDEKQPSSTKALVILLTLLLLGPTMTFFYAIFASKSRALKKATIIGATITGVCVVAVFGIALALPESTENFSDLVEEARNNGDDLATMSEEMMDVDPFRAVLYVPIDDDEWTVSISGFDLGGAVENTAVPVTVPSIYPLNQIAEDPEGPRIYGITTHKVGKIVPSSGHFVELEVDPAVPEISWPSAIAFDTSRRRLVVTSRGGVHTYDPATGEWQQLPGAFGRLSFMSLSYEPVEGVFYGLVAEFAEDTVSKIVKINHDGAIVSTVTLSTPLLASEMPDGRVQLIASPDHLVIMVASHYARTRGSGDKLVAEQTFVVDPITGDVAVISTQ